MSDSDGSPFEGFTEAEVHHIPPTQAVNSVDIVVSPIGSMGSEPQIRTPSTLSRTGIMDSSFRQASIASTPGHSRHSRSRSRVPELSDPAR